MIELKNLDFHLENLGESNRCFNDEEKLGLLYGMTNLEEKLNKQIYLWGKIEGIQNDYYIVYYLNQDKFFPKKKFYYCNDDYEFKEVTKGNDKLIEKVEKKTPFTLFTGVPGSLYSEGRKSKGGQDGSHSDGIQGQCAGSDSSEASLSDSEKSSTVQSSSEQSSSAQSNSENSDNSKSEHQNSEDTQGRHQKEGAQSSESEIEGGTPKKEKKKIVEKNKQKERQSDITELERLSYVIRKIDEEAFIVPYNSVKITNNLEMKFANFTGFNMIEALKLTSWVHFRYPKNLTYDKIKSYNTFFLNNFLDSIKSDIPTSMWNVKVNNQLSKISIMNCFYPGYVFYHLLNTPFYASVYIGNGIPNYDLPFLLP
ncbi:conserved Plasmodium protein, unknown function [Plasmodium knowlesi strain H]|uniref:Radial spoke head protein 9 homolog n=3 Tax=Plasmodium knowlesi TaxID=5850 RepID=A0A5K1VV68_PLAKH|nr:radial spoke head protein 9, putative [Plasmodium knowlesi strain H]OTN63616.1 Uncharacterized protein PKNOH_S140253300 [Plasmodium knowlesi]CAA9990950.1 radial spoke head protein 9, putative [Plasmodium knowlesi strain H]SBO20828.1 conserved Plasmodium protein, unknown function [Plasmodium knowlesi strain H]SBO21249.1 conserved Plasmodium protein, unknown function [Plasmodium knowlesi strain H]VVS80424.1 radial spoke head protein 9, putative [Plasmodium knowlesi strain H]|eukprot:XP_002262233.1 hypothetical protein, conserved in Plasmodium species [Plasmodium knowlesi strain H]